MRSRPSKTTKYGAIGISPNRCPESKDMLRNDHRIMIEQNVSGADHYAFIRLIDVSEGWDGAFKYVRGTWRQTNQSYNDTFVQFTSDNPRYLTFAWVGSPIGGTLSIGATWPRNSSHRDDQNEDIYTYIKLFNVQRRANGEFAVGSILGNGVGELTNNARPHFNAGDIYWSVGAY